MIKQRKRISSLIYTGIFCWKINFKEEITLTLKKIYIEGLNVDQREYTHSEQNKI